MYVCMYVCMYMHVYVHDLPGFQQQIGQATPVDATLINQSIKTFQY